MEFENLPSQALSTDFMDMLKVFIEDNLSEFYYYLQDGKWFYELK